MKRIRILIVDDVSDTRESIRRLLQFEEDIQVVGEAGTGSEALRLAEELQPDIVLMDINMPEMDGIRTTELLGFRVPECAVIIMSVQGEYAYLRRAMMAGAREYIVKPFSGDELASTIEKVYDLEQRKKDALGEQTNSSTETVKQRDGRIISFFSTKGGVGTTTLATNLAVQLASSGKWRVLLLDLNLQFGDVAVFLNMAPKRTIADLTQGSINIEEIQSNLLTHASGLQVLAAPTRPEYAELVNTEHVEQILNLVRKNFDFIICDNVSRFEDISLVSFDASEQIWLVMATDVPTLKNTKLSLEVLDGLHHSDKVRLILNRSNNEMGISTEDIEKSLNSKIIFEIPSDGKALVSSVNRGIPFIQSFPQSKASEGIKKMAQSITMVKLDEEKQNSFDETEVKGRHFKGIRKVFGF